ncbi:MAG: type I secretion system permease/ATPase [Deltaproteobacteria bacterium]|nr:MAG: type I secretion system permease/ATPase [Deltaproteobacteria bacterium]
MTKNSSVSFSSALFCAAIITRLKGAPVELTHLRHHFPPAGAKGNLSPQELARVLKELGLSTAFSRKKPQALHSVLFPVIGVLQSGEYLVIAKYDREKEQFLVHRMDQQRATWISADALEKERRQELLLPKKSEVSEDTAFGFMWFFRSALKYRRVIRDSIFASLFVQLFSLVSPLVFMIVIDKVLNNKSLSTLDVLIFALVVISLFEILLNALRTYLLSHTASRIDLMLGIRLFKHLVSLPLSYFENRQVGDTLARMKELETVRHFITGSGVMLFIDLFFLVVFLVVMWLFSRFLTMIVLCFLPVIFACSFFLTPLLRNKLEEKYSTSAANQSFLVETLAGIETVKSSAAEPGIRQQWEERLCSNVKHGFKSGYWANILSQSVTAIGKFLSVLLLFFGAKEVLAGNLTIGQLIAFNMLSARVVAPIVRLSQIWKEFQQTKISVARIADIFNCLPEQGFRPGRVGLPEIRGEVVFDHVHFRYAPEGPLVLDDISFSIKPGEIVGVVGSTGSGKTTLAKLIQRLYSPEKGRVLVDGVDLAQADASWLRRQLGVVTQDSVLFNTSIRDNITLNNRQLEIEKVMEAAQLSGAHSFIMDLPEGYDTPVGERGLRLSTGQRQRLAIARALAADPAMLIFDEATSALDYDSELFVQKNMKEICRGRTTFIVAHRLSTVRDADRILTLENGKLVENGSPAQLIEENGRFAQLQKIHKEI